MLKHFCADINMLLKKHLKYKIAAFEHNAAANKSLLNITLYKISFNFSTAVF